MSAHPSFEVLSWDSHTDRIRDQDGREVCIVEGEDYARLFCAAPELLDACERFLALFGDSDMRPEDECHEVAGWMRAAVKKAKGGEP